MVAGEATVLNLKQVQWEGWWLCVLGRLTGGGVWSRGGDEVGVWRGGKAGVTEICLSHPPPQPASPYERAGRAEGTAGLGGESQWASGDPQGRAGRTSEHEETECIQLVLTGGR